MARPKLRSGNLPLEATSFVGRRRELAEIKKKLTTARLVSLVGPGGVGKTRLAIRIGTDLGRGFAAGAWLVALADVRDAGLIGNAAVAALDLRDQAAMEPLQILVSYLEDKQLLLVLDNCEHLLDAAAALVAEVLRVAPGVRVIATSREPLQIPGEHVVQVPPLELPPADGSVPLNQLGHNEAVMLFIERAVAASGSFELTDSNQTAVVQICRRLDGLPLAIELAAVRTRVLTAEQILGGGEQALLRRLCVFAGRFTLEDVESVCTSEDLAAPEMLDMLTSLVDKSLVTKEDVKSIACYRLHETMREYATLKLRDGHEQETLSERCLEYYRTTCLLFADQARYRLLDFLGWADLEIENIRAVLHLCLARGDFARGLDIAASMGYYWITHGTTESVRWLDQLLAAGQPSPSTLVRACYLRGFLSLIQGDAAAARPWIARAVATARTTGQLAQLSESLSMAATTESVDGDLQAARRYLDEAEAITEGLQDFPATIELVQSRAVYAICRGDLETAAAVSMEGLRLSREAGDLYLVESMLRNLGMVGMMTGDLDSAMSRGVEALRVARQIDHRLAQYYGLAGLGWRAANSGQARLAAQLLGAAEVAGTRAGAEIMGPSLPFWAQAKELALDALGPSKFEAEFTAGKRMSRDAAMRLALGESPQDEVEAGADGASGPLAKREVEVAKLIAEGLSNKRIGARLFISEATVATHVRNIMNKLGFNSRAQIAGWVVSQER